jgi:hypothetical protein
MNEQIVLSLGFVNRKGDGVSMPFKKGRLYYMDGTRFKYFMGYAALEQYDDIDTVEKLKHLLTHA